MLTEVKPNGEWRVKGIDFKSCTPEMYGALCRLRDYEKTGLNPDDFVGDGYEKKYMYKVFYKPSLEAEFKGILCETKDDAEKIADMLEKAGCCNVLVNRWSWKVLIEE